MPKRPSLSETMRQAVTSDAPPDDMPQAKASNQSEPSHERPARASGFYAATRAGKKKVTASLTPDAHKQLRQLGLDRDMTTEALLIEAINDLFKKYGKRTMA
jgi:hypothetical protein